MSVTCDRSVVFSGYYGFIPQYNWPQRDNWNNVESGVKRYKPNQTKQFQIHNFRFPRQLCIFPISYISFNHRCYVGNVKGFNYVYIFNIYWVVEVICAHYKKHTLIKHSNMYLCYHVWVHITILTSPLFIAVPPWK